MKLLYKLGAAVLALFAVSSCEMHDPYGEIMTPGQAVPTVSWELGSTVANAGDSVSFKGKYYTDKEHTPERAEVWAAIAQSESASATLALTTSLAYTQTVAAVDTVRPSQVYAVYPHSQAVFNGYEFELNAKFPTSQTLKSLAWANIKTWDQEKFDLYYPKGFQEEFTGKVVEYLTKDSLYYNDLRHVYVNYDFTVEQINSVIAKYPQLNADGKLNQLASDDVEVKSDVWYTKVYKTDASGKPTTEENVVGRYYTMLENGVTVYHEIGLDEQGPEGVTLYNVYESSPWVFCRYDDNVGGPVTVVRSEYMPLFKDLISLIPFADWIYNSSDKVYNVNYSKYYTMGVTFKVFDTVGNVGYTTDKMEITLN
jgi:hypothetical protein